ncbi:MAG TPA: hypothetical protein VFA57_17510 [Pseudolabrys sp.]|nr:hypothetical protein [Pseudolabrys sp.]
MWAAFIGGCLVALAMGSSARAGTVLIKSEEAALPPPSTAKTVSLTTRGITRRPSIVLVSPEASVTSPFVLQFKFEAHGGSVIRPNSFHLIYLRTPNVDLTARVRPYVTANGVIVTDAEAPPGEHMLRVEISDNENRDSSAVFVVNVRK